MRQAGQLVAEALAAMAERVAPGVRTAEFDTVAREVFDRAGATPSFLNYPASTAGVPAFPAATTRGSGRRSLSRVNDATTPVDEASVTRRRLPAVEA